jgi:uncharacterized protein (DUF342 family)
MKSEDRIVEILAEYLQKTDRILDRFEKSDRRSEKTDRNISIMSKAIHENDSKTQKVLVQHSEELKALKKESHELRKEFGRESQELRKEFGKETQELRKEFGRETQEIRKELLKIELQNNSMLKELLSISRRVASLEDAR